MQHNKMDKNIAPQKPRLRDQVRERLRYQHDSLSTKKVYVYWIRFFIRSLKITRSAATSHTAADCGYI